MPRNTKLLANAPLARIMKSSGAPRVSESSVNELNACLLVYGAELAKKAAQNAAHAHRTTILPADFEIENNKFSG